MCFGGGGGQQATTAATPAPAPAPAEPGPTEGDLTAARKRDSNAQFGGTTPTTRVDRSVTGGAQGGSGLGGM